MSPFVAISYGALNVSALTSTPEVTSYAIVSTEPGDPMVLSNDVAALWLRLVDGPVLSEDLTDQERNLVGEFVAAGIATTQLDHSARTKCVPLPWLSSFSHELVYAVIASLARDKNIPVVFIKGPVLHAQGLRNYEHSGDVDVWVDPQAVELMTRYLTEWGWTIAASVFRNTPVVHSVTLTAPLWGCEIDAHYRFPGVGVSDDEAFAILYDRSETRHFAGVAALAPTLATHAVVQALHLVRPLAADRPALQQLEAATKVLRIAGIQALETALLWSATGVLKPQLIEAFDKWDPVSSQPIPRDWAWRTKHTTAHAYLSALSLVRGRRRFNVLRELVWPSAVTAALSQQRAGELPSSTNSARFSRIKRGLRQLISRRPG